MPPWPPCPPELDDEDEDEDEDEDDAAPPVPDELDPPAAPELDELLDEVVWLPPPHPA